MLPLATWIGGVNVEPRSGCGDRGGKRRGFGDGGAVRPAWPEGAGGGQGAGADRLQEAVLARHSAVGGGGPGPPRGDRRARAPRRRSDARADLDARGRVGTTGS